MGDITAIKKAENESDEVGTLFFGGLPTDIELQRLEEAYPVSEMQIGQEISYSQVEKIINLDWKSARFRSVTCRWMKKIRNSTGMVLKRMRGEYAFKVLSENEKVDESVQRQIEGKNKFLKSFKLLSCTNKQSLDDDHKAIYHFNMEKLGKVNAAIQIKKNIALPTM
jgi:hypothetical protein